MDLKSLFQVNAVVALLYGIGLLVVPVSFLAMYGIAVNPGNAVVGQLFGASLITIGLISWFAREAEAGVARHAIVQSLCWGNVIGGATCAFGTVTGAVGPMGWSSVGVYFLLGGAYAYFLYMKAEAPQPAK